MLAKHSFQLPDNDKIIFCQFHHAYLTLSLVYLAKYWKNGLPER